MNVLDEIKAVIPQVAQWASEPLEHGAILYSGATADDDWRLQVVVLGEAKMGSAVRASKLLIVKMTDELAQLTLETARRAVP